ncbi:HAMP domain-containing histidine kinase [Kineococcus sp. NBC_00420]|uniref:sensor histidine kinase n=1 Tax=Kineococcus sp. NBC_00420 TaxID=2903564 RepID=UPI002E1C6085
MRTVSLRRRVVAVSAAVVVLLLLAVGVFVDADLGSRLRDDARARLVGLADLGVQLDGVVDDQTLVNRLATAGASAELQTDGGTVVGRPGPGAGPAAGPPGPAAAAPGPAADVVEDGDLLRVERELGDGRVLEVTTSLRPVEDARSQFRRSMLWGGAIGVVVAVLALWLLLGRALVPLDTMTRTARSIAAGDRGRRLAPDRAGTELGRVAVAFDEMLDSLEGAESRASQARDRLQRFLSDAAHDLRTPLAAVVAAAERLLLDSGSREQREEAAVRIVREARRAGRLVSDLLAVSRLEEVRPQPSPLDLADVVRTAVHDAAPGAPVEVRAAAVPLRADAEHVRRVVVNLLANARVAAPGGRVVVVVDRADDGRWGRVVVADDGPGIAPADRELVFERLVRLDPSRTGDGGAGLGLSISRGLARAAGGDLRCADPDDPTLPPDLPAGAVLVLTLPAG